VTGTERGDDARSRLAAMLDELGLEPGEAAPCPYLPGLDSRLVALSPSALSAGLYRVFLDLNFRRLGHGVYRPRCDACRECRQLRVDAAAFRPSRSQRRCRSRNRDVAARVGLPDASAEKRDLYRRYLAARHDGQMTGSRQEFEDFLLGAPAFTREVEFRVGGTLLGVGLFDVLHDAVSAVYFYFDPDLARRSPGVFNVLWLVEECRRLGRPWLYLGYHVPGSPTMDYKASFRPHQVLGEDGRWR
jgi:arginyl-tRNA--protein-N-Asp/Glu arginylyltransferase